MQRSSSAGLFLNSQNSRSAGEMSAVKAVLGGVTFLLKASMQTSKLMGQQPRR